jgi:hypothetical protein
MSVSHRSEHMVIKHAIALNERPEDGLEYGVDLPPKKGHTKCRLWLDIRPGTSYS